MPPTIDELYEAYGMRDTQEIYSNGAKYISVLRIKQWLSMNNYDLAIDKAQAMVPVRTETHRLDCPRCRWTFFFNEDAWMSGMFKYCPECGQKIDWSDWHENR